MTETKKIPATSIWRRRRQKVRICSMRLLLFLLCITSFFSSVVPWGRALARSALILPALVTFAVPPPLQFFGEPVQHTQKTLSSRTGTAYLDIFAPDTPTPQYSAIRGGLLVVSGVGDNRQVPQLVNFLESLARANFVVAHVATPELLNYVLSAQDADAIVKAFQTLQRWPGMQEKRIGIIAFSAGMSAIYFAAADPRIRDQVASLTTLGGYFNVISLIRAIGQRAIIVDGRYQPWEPSDTTLRVLSTMIARYVPPEEGYLLMRAFADQGPSRVSLSTEEVARLSPPSQAAYRILAGSAPEQVDADIAVLPATLHAELAKLSIDHVLGQIHAPIFLLHDYNDRSIPVTELRAFDAALTRLHHPHRYVEFHIFDHVQLHAGLSISQLLGDGTQLFSILADVLATVS